MYLQVLLMFLFLGEKVHAAKILFIFPISIRSHVFAFKSFTEELARRGHDVTVVTPFPNKTPLSNYSEIILQDTFPPRDGTELDIFKYEGANYMIQLHFVFSLCLSSCAKLLNDPNMQKLISSKDTKFDIIIYESFNAECLYGVLHKFQAPTIKILPNTIIPWIGDYVGNPSTTSYVPVLITNNDVLDFKGRVDNFLRQLYANLYRRFYALPKMEALLREQFPDVSISIEEIDKNASFLFLHSHPIWNYPRPFTPNTIEVGGMHIGKPQNLPQKLQQYLDSASYGVIYFSLGSNVRAADMPDVTRDAILKCFSTLKQNILWKWEAETFLNQPKNVLLGKWLPQVEILAHPNTKLFISHSGLMSTQEATYFGVPIVAVPILADQHINALRAQSEGYALLLDFRNITEQSLCWAINEVFQNPQYRDNAKRVSRIVKDQPESPLERALFWTEYAIRHKGASHLRSSALQLNFFQYYLLDVIATLFLSGMACILLLIKILRVLTSRLDSWFLKTDANSKKKK